MPGGRNKAIPVDTREWPEYEFKEFPKFLGKDAEGKSYIAQDEDHEAELRAEHEFLKDAPSHSAPPSSASMDAMQKRLAELEAENAALKGGKPTDGSSTQGEDPWADAEDADKAQPKSKAKKKAA